MSIKFLQFIKNCANFIIKISGLFHSVKENNKSELLHVFSWMSNQGMFALENF